MRYLAVWVLIGSCLAGTHVVPVRPHVTHGGTYVKPHYRTSPNRTQRDNWSSKPNVNPTTGKPGTKVPVK